MRRDRSRPHLLVLNQYYEPGVEATAQLLTRLCESLVDEWNVTVITGRLRNHEDEPDYERRNGVEIVRVHSTSYDRAPLHRRAVNYFTYLARAFRRALVSDRPDVVLTMTDPPLVGNLGYLLAKRFRCPLVVVSQDVFPEIAVQLRRLTNPLAVRVLGLLIDHTLRHADRVVAIGPVMRARLAEKGASPDRTVVIPNWVDTAEITPRPHDNPWAREHGLDGRFVVMHSGNVGHAQNLDVLLRALRLVDDVPEAVAVIVGFGARYDETVELAATLRLGDRVRFLPYQPRAVLPEVLSTARAHFVGLPRGLAGYVVPSRVNGILAAGRPVLAAVDGKSETAALVEAAGCGVVVPPDDPNAVAEMLRRMAQGELDLDAMGDAARVYAEAHIDVERSIRAYHELLRETLR